MKRDTGEVDFVLVVLRYRFAIAVAHTEKTSSTPTSASSLQGRNSAIQQKEWKRGTGEVDFVLAVLHHYSYLNLIPPSIHIQKFYSTEQFSDHWGFF